MSDAQTSAGYAGYTSWETWLIASSVFDELPSARDWLDEFVSPAREFSGEALAASVKGYVREDVCGDEPRELLRQIFNDFANRVNWREVADHVKAMAAEDDANYVKAMATEDDAEIDDDEADEETIDDA